MGLRYPQPDNEDAFEQMCLRFYRKHWKNESLQLYAKRGEKQDGVDIHDPACLPPVRAAQCKFHETTKKLPLTEIENEILKAENSKLRIEHYVIATTAQKTKDAQDKVVALNSRPANEKKFTVEIQFWEDICERLSGFPSLQAHFIVYGHDATADVLASILQDPHIASVAARLLSVGTVESTPGAFSEIEQLLANRDIAAARHELEKLPASNELAKLSKGDQYKVLRLRGKLALETGQFETASQYFLAAYDAQPELDQAKQNRVLAYSLILDSQKSFELAKQYFSEGITTPALLCRLIENASTLEQIGDQMPLVTPHITSSEELNLALCHKLLQLGDNEGASEAAVRAIEICPDSPHAYFAVAAVAHDAVVKGDWRERRSRLAKALQNYEAALNGARQKNYPNLLPEILVNRAAANVLAGDIPAATADYRAAVEAASKPAAYAAAAVSFFLNQEKVASAWELLGFLDPSTIEGRFLTTVTEFYNTDNVEERRRYLAEVKQLAEEDWPRAVECRFHCVNLALLLHDTVFATSCITDAFLAEFPFQAFTALTWIAAESGENTVAQEFAEKALGEAAHGVHLQVRRLLADVLTKLNLHEKALDLREQLAIPGILNDDTKLLISCARRLDRHDLLLRICRDLRETGEQEEQLRKLEIQLLNRYSPEQGLLLADEFIKSSQTPSYFFAFKNVLAIRLNRRDLLQLEAPLPSPKDLSPQESRLVTLPYVAVGRFDDALLFLHAQLRANFENEHAHGQFVFFFLTYGERTSLRHAPMKVEPQCAVLLDIEGGAQRWVTIEDDHPVPSRGEFPQATKLALQLIGRKGGDVIELPGNLVQGEKATIREIQSKYVRAFQDCLQHFRERFPDTSFIQQIDVGSGDDFDFTPIIESLKQRRDYVNDCIQFYKTHPCPLNLFASKVGINELNAIKALAHDPTAEVKCCRTTPHDFDLMARSGAVGELIVLDIAAIVTLTLLEGWRFLDPHRKYFVSQSTKDVIAQWLADAEDEHTKEGGHASVTDDGRLFFDETTKEQREARRAEVENIKLMIQTHCEVQSSASMAEIAPKKRTVYEDVAGFHNLESMSLARDLNAVLWTDDLVLALIAKMDFGVTSAWSQLVLRCFVESGQVPIDDFNLISAKLAAWNFTQIVWNPATIIRGGKHANWAPQQWPLKQCIALIEKSALGLPEKSRIACDCLKLLRRSNCSQLRQSAVIQAILSAVGNRRAIERMLSRLDDEFLLDPESAAFLRPELGYWLDSHIA